MNAPELLLPGGRLEHMRYACAYGDTGVDNDTKLLQISMESRFAV